MPFLEYNGKRILYIHVPKTGGGSIEKWLNNLAPLRFLSIGIPTSQKCTPQHLRMIDIRDLFGNDFFDYVFMTVRNPYDRIQSEYKMRAMLSGQGFWKAWPTFSHWVESNLAEAQRSPFHLDNHLRPQWEFYGSGVEILHFESGISTIVTRIAEVIGAPVHANLPHAHSTKESALSVEFDAIDRLRVQDFYRKDFELFKYDKMDYGKTTDALL